MVNREVQLQALVDKKKVIITESNIRRDLQLEDAEGTECLPTATIFEELTRMGYEKLTQKLTFYKAFFSPQWKFLIHIILQCLSAKTTAWNEFSSTMASAIICLAINQKFNFSKYIFNSMVKNVDSMVKFWMYPRFVQVFVNQQLGDMSHHKKIYATPSHTKNIFTNMKRKGKYFSGTITPLFQTMMVQAQEEMGTGSANPTDPHHTPTITQPSTSQPQKKKPRRKQRNGKDSLKLNELIELYSNLQKKVLDLETTKTIQALEIDSLKKRVKKLEKKQRSITHKLRRLYKVSLSAKVISLDDEASLVHDLHGDEVFVEIKKPMVNATTTTTTTVADEVDMNLAQTLIEKKSAKPKAKGIVMQEPSESTPTISSQQPSQVKGQGSKDKEGVAIDAIPLSTKPPSIIDYKIIKEGKINIYQIIRADGSSKRIVGIKRLHDDLRVTAAQCCWYKVTTAGTKLQLLKGYNCSRIKTTGKIKIDWRSRILHDKLVLLVQGISTAQIITNSINCVNTSSTRLILFMIVSTAKRRLILLSEVRDNRDTYYLEIKIRRIDQGLGSTSGIRAFALRNFDLEVMEFESAQSNTTAKLPILKLAQENGTSVTKMPVPVTAKEKTNKKNDVKARSLLLMALTNEHKLTFSQYSDAKTMFVAIETRFGVWMNKADIETMSIDDLYNNLKIVEQDVKKSVGASSGAQNLAFMTAPSTSSTNDVNTAKPAYEVSTISPNINTARPQVSTANFSDNTVYAFMVENPNGSNLLQQDLEQIHEDDLEAMDLKWQLSLLSMRAKRYQDNTRKQGNNEDTSSKAMLAIDGVGFDWSDMAEEQVQTNMALMAFSDSEVYNDKTCTKTCLKNYETLKKQCDDLIVKLNQTKFTAATYKRGLATIEEQLVTYRKNEVLFSEEVAVLKREVACKDYEINVLKSEFEKVKQEKEVKRVWGYNAVPPPYPLIYNGPTKLDLSYSGLDEFKDPEFKSYGSKDKQVSEDTSSFVESPLNVDKETVFLIDKKIKFVKPKNHEKLVKKSVRYAEMYRSQSPRGNQRNWNGQKSNKVGSDFVMYNKA
ncbi:hypothetical protein Tco_0909790 [Tanacetum coccineum]|uniref:Uncharacterized protein n=1 Tax=Tanacetum coccineum TaxID=301880 RepID=A0ABQ5CSA3_9ASTR